MDSLTPRTVAVIPCFNEGRFIAGVVSEVRNFVSEVIVVDDGSSDNTVDLARNAGARVISHGRQLGAGAATRTGFLAALESGADVLVTLDGDRQHAPEEVPAVLSPALSGVAELVIGSRFLSPGFVIPAYRKFGIDVITFMLNFGAKVKVTDSQSGFRAYSRRAIETLIPTETGFSFSIQTLLEARKRGFKMVEVPISCIYHEQGSTKNPITHGLSVALSVARLRLKGLFAK